VTMPRSGTLGQYARVMDIASRIIVDDSPAPSLRKRLLTQAPPHVCFTYLA
jgi:hypothetical protein